MNRIVTAALLTSATFAASWVIRRWLDRQASPPPEARNPLETWENEGGAVAPRHAAAQASQVPA